eukprot:scaffold60353_cov55-Phaeocystis_antarctica.AAC.4
MFKCAADAGAANYEKIALTLPPGPSPFSRPGERPSPFSRPVDARLWAAREDPEAYNLSFGASTHDLPVASTASWLAAQVVVARFPLGVAEGVVVPDVLSGAAALGGAAAHAACFGHAGEDLELVAHVLASAAGGDLGEIGDVGGAELPRSRFVVFVAEDHGC